MSEPKRVLREFPFKLSEFANKARRLGELRTALNAAESTLDQAKAVFKANEAEIEAEAREILSAVNAGSELRTVECEEVTDFEHGRIYWRDMILGGVLGDRPLTPEERQLQMKLDEKRRAEYEAGA